MRIATVVVFYYLSAFRNGTFCQKIDTEHAIIALLGCCAAYGLVTGVSRLSFPSARLGGPQSRSGRLGGEAKLLSPAGVRIWKSTMVSPSPCNCNALAVVGYIRLLVVNNV
jgi:hypothetical protein